MSFRRQAVLAGLLLLPGAVFSETRYTLGVTGENHLFLVQPSFGYRNDQWRFYTSVGATQNNFWVQETYAAYSSGNFDFTLGRKLVRWGSGYAYTPTGVLDPPRVAADPSDRLNLNQGREMFKIDWVRGGNAVNLVAAEGGRSAVRYNTLIHGFDTSVIASMHTQGINVSRVFGEALEVHGEFAHSGGFRPYVLGGKYTTHSGWTGIAEFYSPPRRHFSFVRISKSRLRELPGWKEWDVDASLITDLTGGGRTLVFDGQRLIGNHFAAYSRVQIAFAGHGAARSAGLPYTTQVIFGLRFHL